MDRTTIENAPAGALTVRDTVTGVEATALGDLAGSASAAAAAKEIEVRALLAERHPRKLEVFREKLLRYCADPGFAEQALYSRKVGRKQNPVSGEWEDNYAVNFSIRFIEAALAIYKHIYPVTRIVYEDQKRMLINVQVYDAENNVGYSQDSMLPKIVERKDLKDRVSLGERFNSDGKRIFIVEATRDELRNVFGAERSKLIRDLAQKLMPFHILAEARRAIDAKNAEENARDPEAAKKRVLDRFAAIGVSAEMLLSYMDRSLDLLTQKDLAELTVLFNGLSEGEFTWADVMRIKAAPAEGGEPEPQPDSKAARLRDKLVEARTKATKAKEPKEPKEPDGSGEPVA